MLFLRVLIIIVVVIITYSVVTQLIIPHRLKKYKIFVLENSSAIKAIQRINEQFIFSAIEKMDEEHTYDNEKMYENISCEDYLIYQLQFKDKQISNQFDRAKRNAELYKKYCSEIAAECHLGMMIDQNTEFNKKKLLLIEEEEFEKRKQHPAIDYSVTVILRLSTLKGYIYDRKSETFYKNDIVSLANRLKNKNGSFYLDRFIWDAICRVERGRVSNKMRFAIMRRDGYRCCHCGKRDTDGASLEIDHIIPVSKGGKSVYDNLQTLCHNCNVEKGNRF